MLLCLLLVIIVVVVDGAAPPRIELVRDHEYHYYASRLRGGEAKFEVIVSYGMSPADIVAAESAIVDRLTGEVTLSDVETDAISRALASKFGGSWLVAVFEDPYGMAYTLGRRSKAYAVLEVNGAAGILIANHEKRAMNSAGTFRISVDGVNAHLVPRPTNTRQE